MTTERPWQSGSGRRVFEEPAEDLVAQEAASTGESYPAVGHVEQARGLQLMQGVAKEALDRAGSAGRSE